jgi:hypothetical protein
MYVRSHEPPAAALLLASSTLQVREDRQRRDQRCGCDDGRQAFCTEHAALIIELL